MDDFRLFLALRLTMACVSQGVFVPDETWQSVEVAHKMVFGSGYQTWEWDMGLRSYLHPLMFASSLHVLKLFSLDTQAAVVLTPRLLQAFVSSLGDVAAVRLFDRVFARTYADTNIYKALYSTNVLILFSSSRTLVNTVEMALGSIALAHYADNSVLYVAVIAVTFAMRPTAAIFWLPLVLLHAVRLHRSGRFVDTFVSKMVPLAAVSMLATTTVDRIFYGRWTFVFYNFLAANVFAGVSDEYGVQPLMWYIYGAVPLFLGIYGVFPLARGLVSTCQAVGGGEAGNLRKVLLASTVWTVAVLSVIKHKEHRFLLPVMPLLLAWTAIGWPRHRKRFTWLFCLANALAGVMLSLCFQRGGQSVARLLHNDETAQDVLYLMPCHSMPLHSHVHRPDARLTFLTCPPSFLRQPDESKIFYEYPMDWLKAYKAEHHRLPTHIVMFDELVSAVRPFLDAEGYVERASVWHTFFAVQEATSSHALVFRRENENPAGKI